MRMRRAGGRSARPSRRPEARDRSPTAPNQPTYLAITGTDNRVNQAALLDRDALARLVVAIDGPSGSGKSTVSRRAAARLGLRYVDTGAMYRALTWLVLREGVAVEDEAALISLADRWSCSLSTDPEHPGVVVDGVDVTRAVRSAEVTSAVSAVSAVPAVRTRLVAAQRELVGAGGAVVEGRDIGTVVFPDAAVKIFLTASGDARAIRRARETATARTPSMHDIDAGVVESTRADLARRDRLDSIRPASPLVKAAGAAEIDTTTMTIDEVVAQVVERCLRAVAEPATLPRR